MDCIALFQNWFEKEKKKNDNFCQYLMTNDAKSNIDTLKILLKYQLEEYFINYVIIYWQNTLFCYIQPFDKKQANKLLKENFTILKNVKQIKDLDRIHLLNYKKDNIKNILEVEV